MERKKVSSIKWSLFLHLAVALILSTSCSVIVNTLASHVEEAIWLKSVDNISEYYEIYNEYSKLFGGELSIPPTQLSKLSKTDAVIIEICDFAITWCSLIFTSLSVLIILTRFYKKRLKNKTIYDLKICNRDDFVALMHNIKNSKNYSTAILTDCFGKIRLVLDVYIYETCSIKRIF